MKKNIGDVNPGLNSGVNLHHFSPEERELITRFLSTEFYITNHGGVINLSDHAKYRYFLLKFTSVYREQFNIEREVVVLFSDYKCFEPRTLDAFEIAYKQHQDLRIEKICSFLISKDPEIEKKVQQLLSNSTESQVIVPFTYSEIRNVSDFYFYRNRIKKHFYSRDLFAYDSPLRKDIYFFGRNDIVHDIVNRFRNGENSGLFGLRRSGKTSIIYAVQRVLNSTSDISVYIDCQDTGFYLKRWNMALRQIIDEIKSQNRIEVQLCDQAEYTEEGCSRAFQKDLAKIRKKMQNKQILLIFDEVERITFGLPGVEHWQNGKDFIHFWRTIRSNYQKIEGAYTFLIISTNPRSVETATILGEDNPLFSQVPFEYIPPFSATQTQEMVSRLAEIMGMEFDDTIYARLTEDFGGHPFLIRMVCSVINKISDPNRPIRVDKVLYQKAKEVFAKSYGNYIEMVVNVLKTSYNDEYEMLKLLAIDDIQTFTEFASLSNDYTNHLIGYNIIDYNNGSYFFKIDTIREYLIENNKYRKIELSSEEMIAEISERRNGLEPRLRNIIRTVLHMKYGEVEAKKVVLDILGEPRKSKYFASTYKDLFNPVKTEIYFEDLKKIISKEWEVFKNIFGKDKEGIITYLNGINKYRNDAHAKEITTEDMSYFRICISKVELYVNAYLSA